MRNVSTVGLTTLLLAISIKYNLKSSIQNINASETKEIMSAKDATKTMSIFIKALVIHA